MTRRPLSKIPNAEIKAALVECRGVLARTARVLDVDVSNLSKRVNQTPILAAEYRLQQEFYGRLARRSVPEFAFSPHRCPRCGLLYKYSREINGRCYRCVLDEQRMAR